MTTAKKTFLVRYNINFWLMGGVEGVSPPISTIRENPANMWRLINFKRARKSHPHHNMTSVFLTFVEQGGNITHRSYCWSTSHMAM